MARSEEERSLWAKGVFPSFSTMFMGDEEESIT